MSKAGAENERVRVAICESLDQGRHWLLTRISKSDILTPAAVEDLGRTAIATVIRGLELSGVFNAGLDGAEPTASGKIELSAAFSSRNGFRAVAAVPGVASAMQILEAFPWSEARLGSGRTSTTIAGTSAVQQRPQMPATGGRNGQNRVEDSGGTETVGCVLFLEVDGVGNYFAGAATGGTRSRPDGCIGGVPIDGAVIHTTHHAGAAVSGVPDDLVSASAAKRICAGSSLLQVATTNRPCGYLLLKTRNFHSSGALCLDAPSSVPCSQPSPARIGVDDDPSLVSILSQSPGQLSQTAVEERQLNVSLKVSVQHTSLAVGFVKYSHKSSITATATVVVVHPHM